MGRGSGNISGSCECNCTDESDRCKIMHNRSKMESDRDLKKIIFELKFLHGNLLDTVNKIAVISEVLGEEDADRILVTDISSGCQ